MARPERNTVDYFPLFCDEGKKMFYLEETYGNDGFAVFIKLLRELAKSEYHHLDLSNKMQLMFLSAKCKVTVEVLKSIINDLVELDKFDSVLWFENNIIWCQDFIDSIQDAYKKRNNKCITYDGLITLLQVKGIRKQSKGSSKGDVKPQSKVKDSKVKESKEDTDGKPQSFNFKQSLIDLGVEKQIADDWMKVRSKKRASNTETAFKSIKTNIEKSKVPANDCIKTAVEKDWRGFEASWLTNNYNDKSKPEITDKQAYVNRKMGLDEPDDGIERLFYTFKGDGWVNRYFSTKELEDFILRTQSEILKSSPKRM